MPAEVCSAEHAICSTSETCVSLQKSVKDEAVWCIPVCSVLSTVL